MYVPEWKSSKILADDSLKQLYAYNLERWLEEVKQGLVASLFKIQQHECYQIWREIAAFIIFRLLLKYKKKNLRGIK